jgi:hypothetical protein
MNCHCSMCRKEHGSAFVAFATAPADGFRWLSGEDKIVRYQASERATRCFCGICGSALPMVGTQMPIAVIPAALLEGDLGARIGGHLFARSKAPWYEITDGQPQYDEFPPEFNAPPGVERPRPAHKDGITQGSCLCGDVAFEITGTPIRMMNCHCSRCRHSRGAPHATNLFVNIAQFHWVRGEDKSKSYKVPDAQRFSVSFCARCGSKVPHVLAGVEWVLVPAGSLDDAPGMAPQAHIFVGSKAPWFEITDEIPQFAEYPPQG